MWLILRLVRGQIEVIDDVRYIGDSCMRGRQVVHSDLRRETSLALRDLTGLLSLWCLGLLGCSLNPWVDQRCLVGGFNGISFLIKATTKILRPHVLEAFAVIHICRLCSTTIGSSIVDALLALELCALLNIVVSVLLGVILCQLLTYDHVSLRALIVVVADPLRFRT